MSSTAPVPIRALDPRKFRTPDVTAKGERRASVALRALETLWFNTGTLCNLACAGCYIESSPTNDRLAYLTPEEVAVYLDEIAREHLPTRLIGFTGGEPFMNPGLPRMLEDALARGFEALVLTNAMRPMTKQHNALLALKQRFGAKLALRVSLDHYGKAVHELERGARSWDPAISGLQWLAGHGFTLQVAARKLSGESEQALREGFARLFSTLGIVLDAHDPGTLVVFPEMDALADVPEISEACWGILGRSPDDVMCASARMVVRRSGAAGSAVVACTLLPYDTRFELGTTLAQSGSSVALNHPHCAAFCVLGGSACSR